MFKACLAALLTCLSCAYAEAQNSIALPAELTAPVMRDIAEWDRLRAGNGTVAQANAFIERRSDWPGLRLLRRKTEANLPIGGSPKAVFEFFDGTAPQTGRGARALIAAYRETGDTDAADDLLVLTWRTMILGKSDESALLSAYEAKLKDHHIARLDMLLWRGAEKNAERMLPLVDDDWQALAQARLALRARADGVDALIEKVPAKLQADPGLAFERMQWRARKGRSEDAIKLMQAASPDTLGNPEAWAGWRRAFARSEMRAGRVKAAYRLASQHGLTSGSHFADLEWLSGYLAMRYQKDGKTALNHFLRFRGAVETPISLGRAGYWEGRAHALMGDTENAELAYRFGAEYQTSFYGLLAAQAAGVPMDPKLTGRTDYTDWRETPLATNSVFVAAQLFLADGQVNRAEQFLRHLTETLPPDQIGSLADFLLDQNQPHLAVMIGKQAARRAIVVPKAYFPITNLGVAHMPVPEELALAIARRESEFDSAVTSGAGAQGLMQVMPATARAVAEDLQIAYSRSRLLSDPAYNARLGTAYLDELMATFQGNVIMTAAGYNAGPGRPIRWMKERGDPREGEIDIVDWIEHIPFDETRNYVMRVSESLPVYRARLTGQVAPINFAQELIARPGHVRNAQKGEVPRPRPRPDRSEALAPAPTPRPGRQPALAQDG